MTTEIEDYLNSLRAELGPMTIAEREEIIREIRAHIRDSVEESGTPVAAVLERLGPSKELAAQYRDGFLVRQASRSVSPLVLLRATLRLATKGLSGVLVFFFGLIGYLTGSSLVLSALLKPFFPANTGLWIFKYGHSVSSGVLSSPPAPPAHEVLGMWYIVVALTAGCLLLLLTTFAIRKCLRLSQSWQSKL